MLRYLIVLCTLLVAAPAVAAPYAPLGCSLEQKPGFGGPIVTVGATPNQAGLQWALPIGCGGGPSFVKADGTYGFSVYPPETDETAVVTAECVAYSGHSTFYERIHALFQVSAASWNVSTGYYVRYEQRGPLVVELLNTTPELHGAFMSLDLVEPIAPNPQTVAATLHGVAHKTIYWGCSMGFQFIAAPVVPVDPATNTVVQNPN